MKKGSQIFVCFCFCLQMVSRKKKDMTKGVNECPFRVASPDVFFFCHVLLTGFFWCFWLCRSPVCVSLSSVNGVCLGSQVPLKRKRPPQSLGNWGLSGTWVFLSGVCLSPLGADKNVGSRGLQEKSNKRPSQTKPS